MAPQPAHKRRNHCGSRRIAPVAIARLSSDIENSSCADRSRAGPKQTVGGHARNPRPHPGVAHRALLVFDIRVAHRLAPLHDHGDHRTNQQENPEQGRSAGRKYQRHALTIHPDL